MYHPFARLAPTTHGAKFENNKGCASMIPELSQYELRQMAEYDRQRAEEDRKLGRRRGQGMSSWFSSGAPRRDVLWNAPFLPWIGIFKLAGLMIGWPILLRRSVGDYFLNDALTGTPDLG
jgi:hypothetical protein